MSLSKQLMTAAVAGLLLNVTAMADGAAVRFVSGGATYEEVDEMKALASQYSFKLTLAAKGSGAYLSDVEVQIVALPKRELVLQHTTEGPLLLAALPPGRYEVTATFADVLPGAASAVKRNVVVPRSGSAQAVMYFDTGD